MTVVDFIARLAVVERKNAAEWGPSDACESELKGEMTAEKDPGSLSKRQGGEEIPQVPGEVQANTTKDEPRPNSPSTPITTDENDIVHLSQWGVIVTMFKSPRAMASLANTLIFG